MICQECDSINTIIEDGEDWEKKTQRVICKECSHIEIINKDDVNFIEDRDRDDR